MKKSLSLVAVAALGMSGVWAQNAVAETPAAAQTQAAPTTADLQAALNAVEAGKPLGKALAAAGLTVRSAAADGTTLLMLAGEQRLEKPLFALLLAGANVNATDAAGRTALTRTLQQPKSTEYELRERMESCVNKLLAAGARTDAALHTELLLRHDLSEALGMMLSMKRLGMNDTDAAGRTLLMRALEQSARHTALMLLSRKQVDCSLRDAEGRMALHYAMAALPDGVWGYLFDFSHTERLLGPDAEWVNAQDAAGRTPLLVLVEKMEQAGKAHDDDIEKAARQLMRSGADATLADAAGRTPLSVAEERGFDDLCHYMQSLADPQLQQWRACAACLRAGDAEGLKRLLEAGADANAVDANGCSLLQYLLMRGADGSFGVAFGIRSCANLFAMYGVRGEDTPLPTERLLACAELLLAAGADVNVACRQLPPPLMLSLGCRDTAVMQRLLAAGADVNAEVADEDDEEGITALKFMAETQGLLTTVQPLWAEMLQTLLDAGADVNDRRGKHSESPLARAVRMVGFSGAEPATLLMVEKMLERQPLPETVNAAFLECTEGPPAVLKRLVAAGADINMRDDRGRTLLYKAAVGGSPATVRWLLANGADVNARDEEGQTVWLYALDNYCDKTEVLRLLVKAGADVLATDNFGKSTWGIVERRRRGENTEPEWTVYAKEVMRDARVKAGLPAEESLFEIAARGDFDALLWRLAAGGCDVNARDTEGRTLLMLAVSHGGSEVLEEDTEICENCGGVHGSQRRRARTCMAHVLLAAGADVTAADAAGKTAVDYAAVAGEVPESPVLKLLTADAAHTDAAVHERLTACMVCIAEGDIEGLRQHLQGVDVNATLRNGLGLMQLVCNMAVKDSYNAGDAAYVPALLSFVKKHQYILHKSEQNTERRNKALAALPVLLAAGCDPNTVDKEGTPVAECLLREGDVDVVKMLMKAGLNLHATRANGRALMAAACSNKPVLELVLAQSPTQRELNDILVTLASKSDFHEAQPEMVLAAGADINGADYAGDTALTVAADGCYGATVKFLLEHGADVTRPNAAGKTAADIICEDIGKLQAEIAEKTKGDASFVRRKLEKARQVQRYLEAKK